MIYDIYVMYEDDEYKDVRLDMALEDYAGACYHVTLTLDKCIGVTQLQDFCFAPPDKSFDEIASNDVPDWVRNLARFLRPRMEEMMSKPVNTRIQRWMEDAA